MSNPNIMLWCNNSPNQKALANKIAQSHNLCGIIIESRPSSKRELKGLLGKVIDKVKFKRIDDAWFSMLNSYSEKFNTWPEVPILEAENINTETCKLFTKTNGAELVCVSGTSLVKADLISVKPKLGIINLHTGLSPYIKGGPNCTNWCISNNEPHLIGNTIMWLDEGIDSGNLVATEVVTISGEETLSEIHVKVMEAGHDLYLRAIEKISTDLDNVPNVPQSSITEGRLFYTKMWGAEQKALLLKNLDSNALLNVMESADYANKCADIKTVDLI